jgi:hypothetical protein
MAGYASVVSTDPNFDILSVLDKSIKSYVVTYLSNVTGLRKIYGFYKSLRRAVKACHGISGFSPTCFLINAAGEFFVTIGGVIQPPQRAP